MLITSYTSTRQTHVGNRVYQYICMKEDERYPGHVYTYCFSGNFFEAKDLVISSDVLQCLYLDLKHVSINNALYCICEVIYNSGFQNSYLKQQSTVQGLVSCILS